MSEVCPTCQQRKLGPGEVIIYESGKRFEIPMVEVIKQNPAIGSSETTTMRLDEALDDGEMMMTDDYFKLIGKALAILLRRRL